MKFMVSCRVRLFFRISSTVELRVSKLIYLFQPTIPVTSIWRGYGKDFHLSGLAAQKDIFDRDRYFILWERIPETQGKDLIAAFCQDAWMRNEGYPDSEEENQPYRARQPRTALRKPDCHLSVEERSF
jgi:hypothetical protein